AKRSRDGARRGEAEVEIVGEVEGRNIVDGEFHAEAGAIYKEERPNAAIAEGCGEGAGSLRYCGALPVNRICRQEVIGQARSEHDDGGNDHRDAPTREEGEKERH